MSSVLLRCSLGDLEVSEWHVREPLRWNWVANLGIGWPEAPPEDTAASVVFVREDGSEHVFKGTVRRSRLVEGTETLAVTVVGGAGKLLADIDPRHHTAGTETVPAGVVAKGIVEDAGETLAAGVEDALDAFPLQRWTRVAGPPRDALDVLADALGLGWRVLADGTIWIGEETWPAVDGAAYTMGGDPDDGMVLYAPDGAPLRPGTTIDGVRAVEVSYIGEPGKARAEVRAALPGDPRRKPDLDLYRATWPGEVKQQHDDGTLNVLCDDARIGDVLNVPLRVGLPGCKVTVPEGTRLCVSFEGSDPRGAYAHAPDQDTSASARVARLGDTVKINVTFTPGSGGANLTNGGPLELTGTITSGHPRVMLTDEGL